MMDWGYMGSGGLAMMFGWIVGLLLLIGLVVWVVALLGRRGQAPPSPLARDEAPSKAEVELELRYARGEIVTSAFVEARSVLRHR